MMSIAMDKSSWVEIWNGLLSLREFSAATLMTSIVVGTLTMVWIFLTLSEKVRLRGRPPLLPGTHGLPLLGETIGFAHCLTKEEGFPAWIQKRIKKYGPVFRSHILGQTTVFMNTPEGIKFLFANEGKLVEATWPKSVATIIGEHSMILRKGEDHKLLRRYIGGFFDHRAVMGYLARVEKLGQEHLARNCDGNNDREVSAFKMTSALTFAIIGSLMASLEEGPEMDSLKRDFITLVNGMLKLRINVPGFAYHASLQARKRIMAAFDKVIVARKQALAEGRLSEHAKSDVLTNFLTVRDEAGRLSSDEEIKDNLLLMLFAGYDTSSAALAMIITYVAKDPQVYELLVEEHKEIVERKRKDGRETDSLAPEDLNAMKYTGRVILESLRLQPPASGGFREAITDFEWNGYTILKGWRMMWSNQSVHYSAEYFKNPEKFDPSRLESTLPPYTFIPFGGGPRTCPGSEFAKMEMMVFVHYLIRNYQWSLIDPDEPIIRNTMPRTAKGTPIRIRKVKLF